MWRGRLSIMMLLLLVGVGVAACEKGPIQKVGEKIDRATGQDKLIGTGPIERAGRDVDRAVKDIKN
jgi:hypothetical protein